MRFGSRDRAPRWPAALLALSLAGCAGAGVPRLASQALRPDPPPVPLRKPVPPAVRPELARAASDETRVLAPAPVAIASLGPAPRLVAAAKAPIPTVAYRVRAGDTVHGVARQLAVPLRGVIDANDLKPPYVLRAGQVLRIPSPRRHVVRTGETVYGISRFYGVELTRLVRLNAIRPPYRISPGQKLILPITDRAGARAPATVSARATEAQRPSAQTGALDQTPPAAAKAGARSARGAATAIPNPPPRASGKFLWPVRGRLITAYGRKAGGLHNDGINISAPRGTPVHAADNGVVAYVGNELRGFGNLILIKHAGGWVTAYAHNESFLVERGDTVRRGQAIARIGSSGNVATPQLHFEIRKDARSVDPTRFLGPQKAAAS